MMILARLLILMALALGLGLMFSTQSIQHCRLNVKVMSFNIRFGTANDRQNSWDNRKNFLVETIQNQNPDFLGTQETLGFQRKFLETELPAYASWGVGRDHGDDRGEMTALFYRNDRWKKITAGHFWLSETPEIPGSMSWDTSLTRMASWVKLRNREHPQLPPVLLINTHFDHRGQIARRESAKLIRRKALELAEGCPIVLTGDFNAGVDSDPYQELFRQEGSTSLRDSYRLKNFTSTEPQGTFSGFQAENINGARIDWIACSPHWHIFDAGIDRTAQDGRTPSDHFPVWAILTIEAP